MTLASGSVMMDESSETVFETLKAKIRQQVAGIPENVCDQLATLWPFTILNPDEVRKGAPVIEMAGFQDPDTQVRYNVVVCLLGEHECCLCLCVYLQNGITIVVERTPVRAIQFLCTKAPLPEHTRRMMEIYIRRYMPLKELCRGFVTAL